MMCLHFMLDRTNGLFPVFDFSCNVMNKFKTFSGTSRKTFDLLDERTKSSNSTLKAYVENYLSIYIFPVPS